MESDVQHPHPFQPVDAHRERRHEPPLPLRARPRHRLPVHQLEQVQLRPRLGVIGEEDPPVRRHGEIARRLRQRGNDFERAAAGQRLRRAVGKGKGRTAIADADHDHQSDPERDEREGEDRKDAFHWCRRPVTPSAPQSTRTAAAEHSIASVREPIHGIRRAGCFAVQARPVVDRGSSRRERRNRSSQLTLFRTGGHRRARSMIRRVAGRRSRTGVLPARVATLPALRRRLRCAVGPFVAPGRAALESLLPNRRGGVFPGEEATFTLMSFMPVASLLVFLEGTMPQVQKV